MESKIIFANPNLLWLLLLLVPLIGYYVWRTLQGGASVSISSTTGLMVGGRGYLYYLRHLPAVLRVGAVALIIVALARPQTKDIKSHSSSEGIDIVLSLDISGSMLARDFEPDRITAAKQAAARFIVERPDDRIGLVVFTGESFTQSPLTTDKASLINLLSQVQNGGMSYGTAIGDGLATAVNRLKSSTAKSKVVILLTDGVNNSGQIAPITAAEIAASYGIRVYTIGVGSRGMALSPVIDNMGNVAFVPQKVEIDEQVLTEISTLTGGEYFRATDKRVLESIYDKINTMERTKVEHDNTTRYDEVFGRFLLLALMLLVFEFLVKTLWIRQIP